MISIIIPIYNQAEKLEKCLNSLSTQTFQDFEIIIVNDGSTDHFLSLENKIKQKFSNCIIINQVNQGSNPARNRGFRESRGEYLLFCDADIVLEKTMLEKMFITLKNNPQAGYVYSSFYWGKKIFRLWKFDAEKLKTMPYIHTTSLIKRNCFPGFDEKIKRLQDWDLFLTILKNGFPGFWINEILFKVDTGGTISNWLPSFFYKLFPFLPQVRKYKKAIEIIKNKHYL